MQSVMQIYSYLLLDFFISVAEVIRLVDKRFDKLDDYHLSRYQTNLNVGTFFSTFLDFFQNCRDMVLNFVIVMFQNFSTVLEWSRRCFKIFVWVSKRFPENNCLVWYLKLEFFKFFKCTIGVRVGRGRRRVWKKQN